MTYRVVQWATGLVGKEAIKGVLAHPELELVGCWVHSPDKVGVDVGEICDLGPIGGLPGDIEEQRPAERLVGQVLDRRRRRTDREGGIVHFDAHLLELILTSFEQLFEIGLSVRTSRRPRTPRAAAIPIFWSHRVRPRVS